MLEKGRKVQLGQIEIAFMKLQRGLQSSQQIVTIMLPDRDC